MSCYIYVVWHESKELNLNFIISDSILEKAASVLIMGKFDLYFNIRTSSLYLIQ